MATRLMEWEKESFLAILKDYSHFLFRCNFLCRKPFFRYIIAASSLLAAEKVAKSASFNFVYQLSREFCSLMSLQSWTNIFQRQNPHSILETIFFQRAGLRVVLILALHLGMQNVYFGYQCSLRLPSNDSRSSLSGSSLFQFSGLPYWGLLSSSCCGSSFSSFSIISSSNFSSKKEQLSLKSLLLLVLKVSSTPWKSVYSQKASVLYFMSVFQPFCFSYLTSRSYRGGLLVRLLSIFSSMPIVKPSFAFFLNKF